MLQDAGLVNTVPLDRHRWQELAPGPIYLVENWTGRLVETWAGAPTIRTSHEKAQRHQESS